MNYIHYFYITLLILFFVMFFCRLTNRLLDKVFSVILNPNYDKLNNGYASGTPLARVVVSFPPPHILGLSVLRTLPYS